jgi:hypothetical protein
MDTDAARMGLQLAGNQLEERGFSDAVAADKSRPFWTEV